MQFVMNEQKYDVRFKSTYRKEEKSEKPLRDTLCTICTVDEAQEGKAKFQNPVKGVAYLSRKDQFNRWVGHKLSFARAVKEFTEDKGIRQLLWEKYKEECPDNWKVSVK